MNIRKIDLMHREFGKEDGKLCKECSNFLRTRWRSKTYRKCAVYGDTCSEATDWKASYPACGMFNKEWSGGDVVRAVGTKACRQNTVAQLDGQLELW